MEKMQNTYCIYKNMKDTKSFLFDFDGVILNSMEAHALSWQRAYRAIGIELSLFDIYIREGMSGRDSIIDIAKEKKIPVPTDDEMSIIHTQKIIYFNEYHTEVYPEIYEIFSFLKKLEKTICIVTGSLRASLIERLPKELTAFVDAAVCSDDLPRGKPAPDPYLKGLALLNASADTSMVIENAPMGIRSAKAAGLFCAAIETSLDRNYLTQSDIVFKNHKELYEYIINQ